jgi:hypothetical protein
MSDPREISFLRKLRFTQAVMEQILQMPVISFDALHQVAELERIYELSSETSS